MIELGPKLSPEEHYYQVVLPSRRNAYALHVTQMAVPDDLNAWVAWMTERHGPTVKVWHNTVPWLEALLVVRYGEAVEHWPAEFSEGDVLRAQEWSQGKLPNGVKEGGPVGTLT